MKKATWIALACSAALYFQQAQAQEVVSATDTVSYQSAMKQISKLASSGTEEDKALLKLEAEALSKKSSEDLLTLSAMVYERALDNTEEAEKIRKEIETKFPNGEYVRDKEFSATFGGGKPDKSLTGNDLEQKYLEFAKRFPAENKDGKGSKHEKTAYYLISTRYAEEGNPAKLQESLGKLKGTDYYLPGVANALDDFPEDKKDYKVFGPMLKEAYDSSKPNPDPATPQSENDAYFHGALTPHYANALIADKNYDEAISVTNAALEEAHYGGYHALKNTKVLGKAYTDKGEKEKALQTYEKFMAASGKDSTIVADAQKLYGDIHGPSADFNTYLAGLDKQLTANYLAKYEKEMVKKEAPNFTLMNRDGKEVSLSDYKGKVVVLDFWATWCGPCIISFPGMQAAVNKYADDSEVEFLFIDTWQREENYKELVAEFLTKNNYNFHVLFDEMKDRSKAAVTAYGIQGIPAKVVIDKEGFIRFQNSGSEANVEKLVKELDTKIELAKRG